MYSFDVLYTIIRKDHGTCRTFMTFPKPAGPVGKFCSLTLLQVMVLMIIHQYLSSFV